MSENTKKTANHPAFTVDNESTNTSEMPSITRLLDRKKLGVSTPPKRPAAAAVHAPPAPPKPAELPTSEDTAESKITKIQPFHAEDYKKAPTCSSPQTGVSIHASGTPLAFEIPGRTDPEKIVLATIETPESPPSPAPSEAIAHPVARRAERRPTVATLLIWDPKTLKNGTDPLGKAIVQLTEKGAYSFLFLSVCPPSAGSTTPSFNSSAAVNPLTKTAVWTGMKWDPNVTPEAWNLLLKKGFVEFPPPGTMTNLQSLRNVSRAAFGIAPDEWLSLVIIGPSHGCRGLLVVISKKGLTAEIIQTLALFQAPAPPKKQNA